MVEDPASPGETPNRQESTESTGEKVKTKSTTTEEKGSIPVTYKWNKCIEHDTAGLTTPIIDFVKQTLLKANSSPTKKSGYLFICAREHNAIVNPWVPCGALQGGEILELDLRKMISESSNRECKEGVDEIVAPEMYKYPTFHDGLFFEVKYQGKTKGGKPVRIIPIKQHYSENNPMAVFGLKGQTIKEALQNDKRFTIPGDFSLEDSHYHRHKSDVLLSELPSDTHTIVVHKCKRSGKRLPKVSLAHEDLQNNAEGDTTPLPDTAVPQSEPSVDPPNQLVPVSSRLSSMFSYQFKKIAKAIGEVQVESQLVKDYEKNVLYKDPIMATTLRLLTRHLDNVALLMYNIGGKSESGTLFLVTESLGITCYHVVKLLIKSRAACSNVQLIFNYESEENIVYGKYIRVVRANSKLDCAFVRIEISPSPPGLLKYITSPPQDGAVSIVGHPSGKHKKIDLNCTVIDFNQRADSIADTILYDRSYIHVLTQHNFMRMNDPTLVTYDSCLYWGASGAPVFDSHGELVAMHTGGYPANTALKKQSVIEYGRSAVDIIILGAINIKDLRAPFRKLVEEKENLRKYLQLGGHPVKMQPYIRRLQKLWEDVSDITESPMDTS